MDAAHRHHRRRRSLRRYEFKVAGTQNGVTGIQLDLKIASGLSYEIVRATLNQAREARMQILRHMLSRSLEPREQISAYAPRLLRNADQPPKDRLLIGPAQTIRGFKR